MTSEPTLEERIARLETARHNESRGSASVWLQRLTVLAVIALVTLNVALVVQQRSLSAEQSLQQAFWDLSHSGLGPAARANAFLKLTASRNTEWRSANLESLSLPAVDLTGADLSSARFMSCDFSRGLFAEANLEKAGIDLCDLTDAVFSKAKLRNATLFKSTLHGADFRNADLMSASLEQTKAHGATFVAARMGDSFLAMADLSQSDFTGADLTGANLEAAILKETDLALTNLFETRLLDTDFTDSNWWRSRGLTSQQLDELTLKFPPSARAPESRQRDFEIWFTKRLSDSRPAEKAEPEKSSEQQ